MEISSYEKSGATDVVKTLSNRNRYLIMELILKAKTDYCVHELSKAIGISQSATSHQLAYLEVRGVVQSTRTGKTKCYVSTNSPLAKKIARVIKSLS